MSIALPSLPVGWSRTRVDRVATVSARIGWKALTAAEYQSDGYAFLSTPNIKGSEIDFSNVNYISEFRYGESPELQLKTGDVLLTKDGNTLGIVNIVRDLPRPATVNGSIAVIRSTGIHPTYLRHVLASRVTQETINMLKGGMGVPHLFQWDINRLPIPLPPLDEQRRIADFLDAETARIDGLDASRSVQLKLLSDRERAMLDLSFLEARSGAPTRLKYLFSVRPRYGVLVPAFTDDGVPFIRVNDLLDLEGRADGLRKIPSDLSAQYARSVVRPGDLLMSVVGTLGRAAIAPARLAGANIARAVCSMRFMPDVDVQLVKAWLGTSFFHEQALVATSTDTAQPTLGMEDLGNFSLNWPSDSQERKHMVREITRIQGSMSSLREKLERQKSVLAERRQALITAAVTGQIDVSTASGRGIEE
ncbi:restriction endonuclease subunit S [Streptomyces sp. NPDC010273]|uniref:restriction endonuclease subunit S n=1 Tax=Streptomyces sp. NPDC010273 TaxID=3364829 RepID=UPI0036EBE6B2